MQKNLLKKFVSTILALFTMITINGCSKNNSKNTNYIPSSIELVNDCDEISVLSVWYLCRNSFFNDFPILKDVEYGEKGYTASEIDSYLNFLTVDYKFDSAYNFLNYFINYYERISESEDEFLPFIRNFIKVEKGLGSNLVEIEFENTDGEYNMSFVDNASVVEGTAYKSVIQQFKDDNMIFEKNINFNSKKTGGSKTFREDATYSLSYKLIYYSADVSSNITIVLSQEGNLKNSTKIKEIDDIRYLYCFYGNELVEQKLLSKKDFYDYTCILYESYLNGVTKNAFVESANEFIKIRDK